MIQYVYDFLSILFDKLKDKEKIRAVILFGSLARGNQRKDSDIDLFIDIIKDNKEEVQQIVKESIDEFELKSIKTWHLKNIKNSIAPIIDDLSSSKWTELRREISSYGILLYGKYKSNITKNKQSVLIEYDLSKSRQKDKMRLLRKLYGYQIKKGKKSYSQEGLNSKIKGEKLNNSIIADIENYKLIANLLKEHKIPMKLRTLYFE